MKTITDKKTKQYIRVQQNGINQEPVKNEPATDEDDVEVQMIQMSPSFLGMPMWKFFVVKDKK